MLRHNCIGNLGMQRRTLWGFTGLVEQAYAMESIAILDLAFIKQEQMQPGETKPTYPDKSGL